MDAEQWRDLCYRSLGIPDDEPNKELVASRHLLEVTGTEVDILGLGAAETAIDLVVRHGEEGNLDEILLGLDYVQFFEAADEAQGTAMACAKALLHSVVEWVETHPLE